MQWAQFPVWGSLTVCVGGLMSNRGTFRVCGGRIIAVIATLCCGHWGELSVQISPHSVMRGNCGDILCPFSM
ncbi:hypothetical protein XELAEV_18038174mg [Xenopus laevis]|uniref:Uncharacterized protein n=1 Tax=Xenopus laevis TaxID=8355 RepID=A0A974C5A7_XENLA|nr:hypothetical protein XELAEV_18038174mg [Xenopus laevis]